MGTGIRDVVIAENWDCNLYRVTDPLVGLMVVFSHYFLTIRGKYFH